MVVDAIKGYLRLCDGGGRRQAGIQENKDAVTVSESASALPKSEHASRRSPRLNEAPPRDHTRRPAAGVPSALFPLCPPYVPDADTRLYLFASLIYGSLTQLSSTEISRRTGRMGRLKGVRIVRRGKQTENTLYDATLTLRKG